MNFKDCFFQLQSCCLEKREQEQAGLCPCLWCSDMFCIFFGGWSPHILSALPQRTYRTARGDPGVEEPRPVGRWQKPSWWFHSWGLSKKRRGWSSTDLLGFRMFNTCSIYIYTYNYIYILYIYIYYTFTYIIYIYGFPIWDGWTYHIHPMTKVHIDQLDSIGNWLAPTCQMCLVPIR